MSFADQLVLWLHIGFAIFTIGPVTLAISSTPRYIRKRDVPILRYLARITLIFTIGSLAVLVLGIVLGQLDHELSKPWLTAAMTLFLVAIVLLVLIIRDQRKAIRAVEQALQEAGAAHSEALVTADGGGAVSAGARPEAAAGAQPAAPGPPDGDGQPAELGGPGPAGSAAAHAAIVERGRIAAMGGVVNLIWLVILALMVWRP
jgi:cbb3-type cytochrome oxidase subunit 3